MPARMIRAIQQTRVALINSGARKPNQKQTNRATLSTWKPRIEKVTYNIFNITYNIINIICVIHILYLTL